MPSPVSPARLLPGITLDSIRHRAQTVREPGVVGHVVRGRALIFWDPKRPGRKLDAIDTDQITPAADCVSESLETLDERWKAGSFRHLMPDFRERVHAGETLRHRRRPLRDRLARARCRPAGLKGVAEEAGLELVVVCGDEHGRHLPPQRVQPRAARRAVPRGGGGRAGRRRVRLRPRDARAHERDARQDATTPVPLTPKEEEIRRSGGIFAVGRREFARLGATHARGRASRTPHARAAHDHDRADRLGAPRRQGRGGRARARRCASTPTCCPPPTAPAPFAIHTFNQITGGDTIQPRQAAIANDHFVFTGREADDAPDRDRRAVRASARHRGALLRARRATGSSTSTFPEQGLIVPGGFYPGRRLAQPRLRRVRRGRHRRGLDHARLRLGDGLRLLHAREAAPRRASRGALQPWVSGKDIVLALLARWGAAAVAGHGRRVRRRGPAAPDRLPQHDREHDGRGRGAERHLRAPTRSPTPGSASKGIDDCPIRASRPARTRATRSTRTLDSTDDRADDREAVQPRERVPRRGGRARAPHVRQGDDRLVHERRLRRSAAGRARAARRARRRARRRSRRARVRDLPGIGRA